MLHVPRTGRRMKASQHAVYAAVRSVHCWSYITVVRVVRVSVARARLSWGLCRHVVGTTQCVFVPPALTSLTTESFCQTAASSVDNEMLRGITLQFSTHCCKCSTVEIWVLKISVSLLNSPTHKRRLWELCLSGALQSTDWLIENGGTIAPNFFGIFFSPTA